MARASAQRSLLRTLLQVGLAAALGFVAAPGFADPGETITNPEVIPELPIEVETEVGPAGSLKIAPLWKETIELLEDPHAYVCQADDPATLQDDESVLCEATTERRPFFTWEGPGDPGTGLEVDAMPPLRVFHACHNVLTGQPLRMRPDEEIDWNQPGYLFDTDEVVAVTDPSETGGNVSNIPIELRSPIGALVSCVLDDEGNVRAGEQPFQPGDPCQDAEPGTLVVSNPSRRALRNVLGYSSLVCTGPGPNNGCDDPRIPPHGTEIAEPACNADRLLIEEDEETGEVVVVDELEQPVNETHFMRNRLAAEILGKALFWDMQIGSDVVQACGSCHFHVGADDRTRNQLNPNTNGGDLDLEVLSVAGSPTTNVEVVASDFPFHMRNPDVRGDGTQVATSDADDVMSSMGISEFRQFDDVLVNNNTAFGPPTMGVRPLSPDVGTLHPDPIAIMDGVRRIEPRNTPTFHAAAFNFDNFWDGRARHDFNGGSVFGPADPFFHVYVSCGIDSSNTRPRQLRELAAPLEAEFEPGPRPLCDWTEDGGNYLGVDEGEEPVPVRIRFSSLASQAVGPPLSDFEMAFGFIDPDVQGGRNWQKIGKKLLQGAVTPNDNPNQRRVTPLAKQLVAIDDSRLGPWSNQGGTQCIALGRPTAIGKPGLCTTYRELIRAAFRRELWNHNTADGHFAGTPVPMNNDCAPGEQIHELGIQATCDPFDGYVIDVDEVDAFNGNDTDEFRLEEANFALFFGLSVQAYEQLTIPDHTPWDQFNDLYPLLGNGVAQPGEQGTLHPSQVRPGVLPGGGDLDTSVLDLDLDGDGMTDIDGDDVLFGFDLFAGGNLTAALPTTSHRNPPTDQFPQGAGSNPFLRTARCMLCHLGPEQSDHTNNVNAGLLQSGTEQEFPFPQGVAEPTGVLRLVTGFSLAEELEENAQDGVEVENRNFNIFGDDLSIPPGCVPEPGFPNGTNCQAPVNAQTAQASANAFQDNGIYNIGLRPTEDDLLRGGDDPFGWPLALSALAMKNLGGNDGMECSDEDNINGECFEPCDTETEAILNPASCNLPNFDPDLGVGGGLYETVGDCLGCDFEGTGYFQDSINPGLDLEPADPLLPEYLAEWANNLPAGEANPLIDELAFAPNTISPTPVPEYGEILFGADLHCGVFDPDPPPLGFGMGPPSWGWGAVDENGDPIVSLSGASLCPNSQTGVPTNMQLGDGPYVPGSLVAPPNGTNGTGPRFANRVARNGAAKVPQLRNVELTGPYFHTGSYLTLRQVVDFYVRGGDFPLTNAEDRDPNLTDLDAQAFSFGSTEDLAPLFLDGIPDVLSRYDLYPDNDPPGCAQDPPNCTPEPFVGSREDALEDAKNAIVAFLLALTDERAAHRSAPFDQPEIFVPIDGAAPANTGGRAELEALSGGPCAVPGPNPGPVCFEQIPATGRTGQAARLEPFLDADHFARNPGF